MESVRALDRRPGLRWLVPGVALATIAGVAVLRPVVADASTGLEPLSARELLVKAQQARPVPMSGTVTQRLDLGLPDLPAGMTGHPGTASLSSLVSGTRTWQVWYAGPHQARLALIGRASESDIIRNGQDVWVWSSAEKTARRYQLPASVDKRSATESGTSPTAPTAEARRQEALTAHGLPDPTDPGAVADWALAQLDPTTTVETTSLDQVAGRSVYGLRLIPKESNSLIASVQLALDGKTFVPLAVQVNSTKLDKPAIDIAYSRVSFDKPANSVFEFTPPPGTDVTTTDLSRKLADKPGAMGGSKPHGRTAPGSTPDATSDPQGAAHRPTVAGTGWGRVVAGRLPADAMSDSTGTTTGSRGATASPQELLQLLPKTSGSWGTGRVLDGTLFSAVLTDDGRYAAGPVSPDTLYAALPSR